MVLISALSSFIKTDYFNIMDKEIDNDLLEKVSFVRLSKYRLQILKIVKNNIMMPSEIKKEVSLSYTHLSRHLNSMKDKNIIVCLNEHQKKGRYYKITPKGGEVLEFIEELEDKNKKVETD